MKFAELSIDPQYFRWQYVKDDFNIEKALHSILYVHDADNCGDSTTFWVVQDYSSARFYRCIHSWEIHYTPEWDISNSFTITEVSKDQLDEESKANLVCVV